MTVSTRSEALLRSVPPDCRLVGRGFQGIYGEGRTVYAVDASQEIRFHGEEELSEEEAARDGIEAWPKVGLDQGFTAAAGGPGETFSASDRDLFGLGPGGESVWWSSGYGPWSEVAGGAPAHQIYAYPSGVCVQDTEGIRAFFHRLDSWSNLGHPPGQSFLYAVNAYGLPLQVYAWALAGREVWQYRQNGWQEMRQPPGSPPSDGEIAAVHAGGIGVCKLDRYYPGFTLLGRRVPEHGGDLWLWA